MRGGLHVDRLAVSRAPGSYGGPWWLLRIPGWHMVPGFAERRWWTWIPEGAEVFACAEVSA